MPTTDPGGPPPPPRGEQAPAPRWAPVLAGVAVAGAALAAYAGSLSGPFIFDDRGAVLDNPSIRRLWGALTAPRPAPLSGRPLLSLSYAANYALGGFGVEGYHALNLGFHILAGLALLGIVRRTLLKPVLRERFGRDALPLATLAAALWTVHPLATAAVTYVSERAEAMMGMFYLLSLYFFVRGEDSAGPARWRVLSVAACLLGALTKEVIATAPLLVLLYDRTFCAGSFRSALRLRGGYYLGLASTWLLLALLSLGAGNRGVGFAYGVEGWRYALLSCKSVLLYLKLSLWPHPLVFYYGLASLPHPAEAVPYALALAVLLVLAAVALRRWPPAGFACAWFLVVLAPTSSVIPIAGQPTAEHRAYLSLAAVVCLAVLFLYRCAGRAALPALALLAVVLGGLTFQRNLDYRSELGIWSDTLAKQPGNPRAHTAYGFALAAIPGRLPEAISEYETSLGLEPGSAETHTDLGVALAALPGRLPEAISHYEAALQIDPGYAQAHVGLGAALAGLPGREEDAIAEDEAALRATPGLPEAHNNLGLVLARRPGRLPDAIVQFEAAVRARPDYAEAHDNLGMALAAVPGRQSEAMAEYEAALRINPGYAKAHNDLGISLANTAGRMKEAVAEFEEALRLQPGYADAKNNLETARRLIGRAGMNPN